MRKVYLAGPINGVEDPHTWRRDVAAQLPLNWAAINPLDLEMDTSAPALIVSTDLQAIEDCQAVLALVDEPSWGTAMEIRFATLRRIPVIGWAPKTRRPLSPWLIHHCRWIVSDFQNCIMYLEVLSHDR